MTCKKCKNDLQKSKRRFFAYAFIMKAILWRSDNSTHRRWVVVGEYGTLAHTIWSLGGRAQDVVDLVVQLGAGQEVLGIEDANAAALGRGQGGGAR